MSTQDPAALRTGIRRWAAVAVAAHVALALLSYGLAPFAPRLSFIPERMRVLAAIAASVPGAEALGLDGFVAGRGLLAHDVARVALYLLPVAVATLAALAVLRLVTRAGAAIDRGVLATLQRAALAFAAVNVLRFPVFTSDFWISIAWGRMAAAGVNPYYHNFTPESLEGLALPYWPLHMTYGPLWGAVCGAIALAVGHSVPAAFLLHKLVIAGAWIGMVVVIRRAAEQRSARDAAMALCLAGWLPASVMLTAGEGHNDALLALGVALFLWFAASHRPVATWLALTASVLVKYTTAPLAGLGLLHALRPGAPAPRRLLPALALSLALAAGCFALFWRGPGFFDATTEMQDWRFLTPATAAGYALWRLGLPAPARLLDAAVLLTLLGLTFVALRGYVRTREPAAFSGAALAILCVVVFSLVGHVWPWFTLWLVPPAVLAARGALARWVLGVIALLPALDLAWMLRPNWSLLEPLAVVVFGGAAVLAVATAASGSRYRWARGQDGDTGDRGTAPSLRR